VESIKDTKRIILILKEGKVFEGAFLKVHYRYSEYSNGGFVISLSKKLGKAVKRNYIKRVIRNYLKNKNIHFDILIRPKTLDIMYKEVVKDFEDFWRATSD
jgi:ribonuclease P protein component